MSISKKIEPLSEERIIIGKVLGAHGVNGTMILLPLTDYPERFFGMKKLTFEAADKPKCVSVIREIRPYVGKNTFFLRVLDITDRDAAEARKGYFVTVSKDERAELHEDEYWIDDILGMGVKDCQTGKRIGHIEEVFPTGSNDVYLVRTEDGRLRPIPALADVIREIDIREGSMTVSLPEGLWD